MMEDDDRDALRIDYMASTMSVVARLVSAIGGNVLDYPNYFEMIYPEQMKEHEDTRTGDQIYKDLIAGLKGRRRADGRIRTCWQIDA